MRVLQLSGGTLETGDLRLGERLPRAGEGAKVPKFTSTWREDKEGKRTGVLGLQGGKMLYMPLDTPPEKLKPALGKPWAPKPKSFKAGDSVRVTCGSFAGMLGTVESEPRKGWFVVSGIDSYLVQSSRLEHLP